MIIRLCKLASTSSCRYSCIKMRSPLRLLSIVETSLFLLLFFRSAAVAGAVSIPFIYSVFAPPFYLPDCHVWFWELKRVKGSSRYPEILSSFCRTHVVYSHFLSFNSTGVNAAAKAHTLIIHGFHELNAPTAAVAANMIAKITLTFFMIV